jgi:hypothetical protein
MKYLHVVFTDSEFAILKKMKGEENTWHDYVLQIAEHMYRNPPNK